ncbi:phosphoribosyltransferase [Glycomyces sp. NPDC049804]|uniref:phosphoribosyltransferase n=1 Tax=Glycomyces sp. NPDC049804 TaxID=3154363 RepID=UPI003419C668
MGEEVFADRRDAGRRLARLLGEYGGREDVVVLGLARGGIPVAFEVARALEAPLDVFTVRKIGVPGQEELAMGAIASGGAVVMNYAVADELGISSVRFDLQAERASVELERRERAYRGDRPPLRIEGRTVILVDDGLATGTTMRASVRAVRELGPARLVVAVPTATASACREVAAIADDVVCVSIPQHRYAVSQSYDDFAQTTDDEVRALLAAAADGQDDPAF